MYKTLHRTNPFGRVLTVLSICAMTTVVAEPEIHTIAFHPVPLFGDSSFNTSENPILNKSRFEEMTPLLTEKDLQSTTEQYLESIHNLELADGPFNIMIAQQSQTLGDLLDRAGDHEGAVKAFEKSLHVLRVNEGLYSTSQETLLRKIIKNQLALNNMSRAHELHESLLYLQKHNHAKSESAYIAAILEWADWNVDRLSIVDAPGLNGRPGQGLDNFSVNLFAAQESYIEAIELIRNSGKVSPVYQQNLIHAEKKLAAINYIANSRTTSLYSMYKPSVFEENDSLSVKQKGDPSDGMAYFFNGSSALKRAIAYSLESPQPDYLAIAEQMMVLGDWYLLFDRRAAALAIYEDAFEVLNAVQASESDIQRIMTPGMPVTVPATSRSIAEESDFQGYIDVEFQVSKFGIATRPEVIASSEQDVSPVTNALIRKIRNEKFRPAFSDGSATSSENVKLRYYYSYN